MPREYFLLDALHGYLSPDNMRYSHSPYVGLHVPMLSDIDAVYPCRIQLLALALSLYTLTLYGSQT